MEPISITIITYVSYKFIDQFIKEEGYGRLKKKLFPSKSYQNKLIKIIYDRIIAPIEISKKLKLKFLKKIQLINLPRFKIPEQIINDIKI